MNEIRTVTKNMRLSQWADVIRDCKASGLTIAAYCREHNISRSTYFYWQREIKKAAIAEASNLFVEVEPACFASSDASGIRRKSFDSDINRRCNDKCCRGSFV